MTNEPIECAEARRTLSVLLAHQGQHALAVSLLLDGCELGVEPPLDAAADLAVAHVLSCASCQSWRVTLLEPERIARRDQIAQHCCPTMFSAVNGELEDMTIRLIHQQPGDDRWVIERTRIVIQFCPWCGEKLAARS